MMMMVLFHTQSKKYRSDTTVTKMQKLFEREDYLFKSTYDSLTDQMKKAIESDRLEQFLKELAEKPYIQNVRDHLGRTLLHVAVEKLNINFVRCMINVGCNPNARGKCGITPLVIAVLLKCKGERERSAVYKCAKSYSDCNKDGFARNIIHS
jgi:ankyrin repeat protein